MEPAPAVDRVRYREVIGSFATGVAILLFALCLGANRAWAEDAPAQKFPAPIAIFTATEEGKKVIIAKVTRDGKPIEGAHVIVQAKRTFGNLTLGEDDTLADGTVAVPFPSDLPSGPEGRIQVVAQIKSPPELAAVATEIFEGARKVLPPEDAFPRALWSPHAPLGLLITIGSMLTIVWSVYLFVVIQLIKIRKESTREKAVT